MRIITYKANQLVGQAIGCAVLAAGGVWAAFQPEFAAKIRFVGAFLALCLPVVAAGLFMRWKSGNAALRFDGRNLHISTFFRSVDVRWPNVRNIERHKLTRSSAFGLIKQDLAHYIVITVADDDNGYEEYRVQEELLDVPKAGIAALVDDLHSCWAGALSSGQKMEAMPPAPRVDGVPLPPARPAFGRKMA